MATELAALNIKISGDSADLQSDIAAAKTQLDSFEKSTTKAGKGAKGFSGSLGKLSNVSGQTRAKIQNTSFQLQDIAVQLQGGTKASTALAQQLPQLLGGFGALGAIAGVVAGIGIPAVAFAFSALKTEAKSLEDALEEMKGVIEDLQAPLEILKLSADELKKKYGAAAGAVTDFARSLAFSKVEEHRDKINESISALDKLAAEYTRTSSKGSRALNLVEQSLKKITKDFGLSEEEAKKFSDLLIAVTGAKTFEQQLPALDKFNKFLLDSNVVLKQIPSDLADAITNMLTLATVTAEATTAADNLAEAAATIPVNIPHPIHTTRPRGRPDDLNTDLPKGRSKVDPLPGELERLQKSLMTKEELQIASFNRQQETLKKALNQELLTRQEYNLLMEDAEMQHAERMAGIAVFKHGDTLQQTEAFMGGMASALSSGNEQMMKAAKVFGAAEALINSFRAYNQVIADPTLPWFAKIPAAVSVLGAGLGMVNAIKGVSAGGGGGGAASAASGAAATASRPMEARISGLDPNSLFTGASITSLFDALQDEAGDRGLSVSFA
jgi:DNA-binding Lrp family transcriptional regulator